MFLSVVFLSLNLNKNRVMKVLIDYFLREKLLKVITAYDDLTPRELWLARFEI